MDTDRVEMNEIGEPMEAVLMSKLGGGSYKQPG